MRTYDPRTELFRASWSLYDTVIAENYMYHREIESVAEKVLNENAHGGSLLDLGCGNARGLAAILRKTKPRLYVGVDVSRPALDQASAELAGLPEVRLLEEDMLACVDQFRVVGQRFDFVHSSFAVHHLTTTDKERLFQSVAQVLTPAGGFLLADLVRAVGQSREDYLKVYLRTVDSEWLALNAEQRREVREHVTAFDFPETVPDLTRMAQAAGFQEAALLGEFREHQVMLFRKVSQCTTPAKFS